MAELEPDWQIQVWRYTYSEGGGGGGTETILLNSPQESEDKRHDTLVLRQVNSDAENKVWVQEQASKLFKRTSHLSTEPLMDDAHGVLARHGHARTIPKDGEMAVALTYCRGDRVWIERSLVPTHSIADDGNKIPVVDLESFNRFLVPFEYISFVPQLVKKDDSGAEHHAVAVGPILNTFLGKRKAKTQIYFRWPADKPDKVSYVWLNRKDKEDLKEFAGLGLLFSDEIVQGPADPLDSSSDSEEENLEIHWNTGTSAQKNCCNPIPCPVFNNPDVDLVASLIGGYRWMEHYHVQDEDTDECPRGAEHKGHCILRDNQIVCAYATDRVRHTCCKLRMNPLLPGSDGDPDDIALLPWETTVGDDHFIDVSRNVRTRTQLEDRDEIPPEMERLRQQLLTEKAAAAAAQQNAAGTGDVNMANVFATWVGGAMNGISQAQGSGLSNQYPFQGGGMLATATMASGFPLSQKFNQPRDQTFTQLTPGMSFNVLQLFPNIEFCPSMPITNIFDPSNSFASQLPGSNDGPYRNNGPEP